MPTNDICAMISIKDVKSSPFENHYVIDFGAPLICIDSESKKPILTGILSTNASYTKDGPGLSNLSVWILEPVILFVKYLSEKHQNFQ